VAVATTAAPKAAGGAALPASGQPVGGGFRRHLGSLAFLAPAAIWLLIITLYPVVATFRNSLYDESATNFVGLQHYKDIFTTPGLVLVFRNNAIWVIVFPFVVTFLGLVFAVLTERIKWSTAFKTIVFMPIVFSGTASGLVWRQIFDLDPHIGIVNATLQTVSDWVNPPGLYPIDVSSGQSVSGLASTGLETGPSGSLQSSSTAKSASRRQACRRLAPNQRRSPPPPAGPSPGSSTGRFPPATRRYATRFFLTKTGSRVSSSPCLVAMAAAPALRSPALTVISALPESAVAVTGSVSTPRISKPASQGSPGWGRNH
jgi:alpha-glucoside transport system permease protein